MPWEFIVLEFAAGAASRRQTVAALFFTPSPPYSGERVGVRGGAGAGVIAADVLDVPI
jgi:hypothetical protein